jgi:hypothetical protein
MFRISSIFKLSRACHQVCFYSDSMTDNRKAGIALISGSVGGIVTMAIHPTAGGPLTPQQVDRLATVSGIAHALAMVSFVLLFLGALGLTRAIATRDRTSIAGLVIFGFACVAVFQATAVSGFIVPAIIVKMAHDVSGNARQWQIVIDSIFQFNQAFARIYSVAASLAVILWSLSVLRHGGFSRGIAIYGCIISALIIVAVAGGFVKLNVHGMAMLWFSQAIWFILLGSQLCSDRELQKG